MKKNCYSIIVASLMLTLTSCVKKQLENGYEWVDLGLSVKWATCNVGASHPEEYGILVGWSDVSGTKMSKDYNDYPSAYGPMNISGDSRYDIACVKMGGNWRMPTYAEYQELVDNCTWQWSTVNGSNGYLITGANGNQIFLPAAGYRKGETLKETGGAGYYWTGTSHTLEMIEEEEKIHEQNMRDHANDPYYIDVNYQAFHERLKILSFALQFNSQKQIIGTYGIDSPSGKAKYEGCSIRAVCP